MNSLEAIHVAVSTIGSGNIFFSEEKLSFVKTLVKVYLQCTAATWNNRPCLLYHLHLRKLFLNVHGLNYRHLNYIDSDFCVFFWRKFVNLGILEGTIWG